MVFIKIFPWSQTSLPLFKIYCTYFNVLFYHLTVTFNVICILPELDPPPCGTLCLILETSTW